MAWKQCEDDQHDLSFENAQAVVGDGQAHVYIPCTRCPVSIRKEVR